MPKMGIYEPTSAHPDRAKDCVVLVTCGGDPALRREVGEAENRQRERERISILSPLTEQSFFAQRQVYLC